jgi:hypothetical protein
MANRSFHPFKGALEIDVAVLYGQFAVGASGAPTLSAQASKGIKSVVRNSAGKYTVTLQDSYAAFLWGAAQILDATNSDPTAVGCTAKVNAASVSGATPTFVVTFYETATPFTPQDPRNGATVYLKLELRNSSVG